MTHLERLVERLFDYAGMFPPAALEMHEALRESAEFPTRLKRRQMVAADMVLTPEHLPLLSDDTLRSAGFEPDREVKVCLVGIPLDRATDAVDRIRAFHTGARDAEIPKRVVALELADDRDLQEDRVATATAMKHVVQATTGFGIALYYEPRWGPAEWREGFGRVLDLLEEVSGGGIANLGLKVRCAGPTALDPDHLAPVVAAAADRHIPFKATQGLHHPVVEPDRHDSPCGFLGLLAAHRLRAGLGDRFPIQDMIACIREEDAQAFRFDEGLAWRAHSLAGEAMAKAQVLPFNIGSCSIKEPDDDLVRLYGAPSARVSA